MKQTADAHTFSGSFITSRTCSVEQMPFIKVSHISEWKHDERAERRAYVIPTLHADFFLLFPSARVIISAAGSPLSHLAILAREYDVPLFLASEMDYAEVPESGICTLNAHT